MLEPNGWHRHCSPLLSTTLLTGRFPVFRILSLVTWSVANPLTGEGTGETPLIAFNYQPGLEDHEEMSVPDTPPDSPLNVRWVSKCVPKECNLTLPTATNSVDPH